MNAEERAWAIEGEFRRVRALVERFYERSRETSLVLTKLDEAELWLTRAPAKP